MKKFNIIILFSMCFLLTACNSSSRPITVQNTQVLSSNVPPVPDGMKEKVAELLSDDLEVTSIHIKRGESYLTAVIDSPTISSIAEDYENGNFQKIDEWRSLRSTLEGISTVFPDSLSEFGDGRPVSLQLMDESGRNILLSIMKGEASYDKLEQLEKGRNAEAAIDDPDEKPEIHSSEPEGPNSEETSGDGSNFNEYDNPDQQETSATFVLNTNTMKFHYPSCNSVPKISPENYETYTGTRYGVIAKGYSSCGSCNP